MTFAQQLRQEGLQQGRREEDFIIAKKMLARGYEHNAIKDLLELSDQDLLCLEKKWVYFNIA